MAEEKYLSAVPTEASDYEIKLALAEKQMEIDAEVRVKLAEIKAKHSAEFELRKLEASASIRKASNLNESEEIRAREHNATELAVAKEWRKEQNMPFKVMAAGMVIFGMFLLTLVYNVSLNDRQRQVQVAQNRTDLYKAFTTCVSTGKDTAATCSSALGGSTTGIPSP